MNQSSLINALLTVVAVLAFGFLLHWGWNLFG